MSEKFIKVAVIGVGSMAQTIHLPMVKSLCEKLELEMIVDPFLEENQLRKIAELYNCKYSRTIEDVNSDLAIIVTPISSHFEIAHYLIKNVKYILIEKAVTNSIKNLECLIEDKNELIGKRIFVAHMRRFYKNINIAKKVVANGFLGNIKEIKIYEGNLYGWNRKYFSKKQNNRNIDEGVLFDVGSHGVDSFSYIFADFISDIKLDKSIVDDLEFMSNVFFSGNVSLNNQDEKVLLTGSFSNTTALSNMIWIKGEKGTLTIPSSDAIRPKLISNKDNEIIELDIYWNSVNPFYSMYDNIIDAIKNNSKSILDIENFVNTTKILETAYNNAQPGKIEWI
jgi:predicted dehydrogenase